MVVQYIFFLTLLAEILLGGTLILTLLHPGFRVWPPPSKESWQYRLTWSLTALIFLGLLLLGLLDWGSMRFPPFFRFGFGPLLMISGLAFALWAMQTLGVRTTLGLGGRLVRVGPYRFSRNPQYVGDIALIAGYVALSSSRLALITGAIGCIWFALAPFVEEPWLRRQLGEEYGEYLQNVPRYLGLPAPDDKP